MNEIEKINESIKSKNALNNNQATGTSNTTWGLMTTVKRNDIVHRPSFSEGLS